VAEIPTPTGYSSQAKSRPLGITILAILMILGGLLNLMGISGSFYYTPVYGIYTAVSGVLGLILGIAMWQLIPWARKAAILWYIISLLISAVLVFYLGAIIDTILPGLGTMTAMISIIPSLVIGLIIILYLNSGGVKAAFQEVGGW